MGLGRRLVPIATALVFAWFVLAVCYGIAGPWQFGHNGFNGSAFCQGARNSLRFHIWAQSLYHTGLEPPPPHALYTHHPQMLHWHLLALFKVFSPSPFVGRLVPMLYSVATLVLLQRTAARYWGPVHALLAIAIYAFTPLHVIFGNMIDHEQGAIFWSLLLTWAFARWWEERRPRHLLLTLVAVSFAGQFDWPPYYIAFFLALFTFVQGLRSGRPLLRWRTEWTFVVVFSLVVLANFGGFFAWIARTRGGLGDMGSAYLQRTAAKEGYAGVQLRRLLDLHGILVMTVTALWVPLLVRRLRAGTARIRELIPGCFFAAQVLHSLLFRNAGAIHSYWTYWLGVASALGGADVVVSAYAVIVERARGRRLAPVFVGLVVLGVGLQARYAYARLEWGFARGTASYLYPTPDIRTEVRAMQALHARYPRERTLFVFHSSMDVRSEVHWYHDTPLEGTGQLIPRADLLRRAEHVVVLADLRRLGERHDLQSLSRIHPTMVFERRIVAIEVNSSEARLEAFAAVPQAESWLHHWLYDPLSPPMLYVPDDLAAVRALFDWGDLVSVGQSGSGGGSLLTWDCPKGQHVAALEGSLNDAGVLTRVRARCRRADGSAGEDTPFFGGLGPPPFAVACPVGSAVVGFTAVTKQFVEGLAPRCAPLGVADRVETTPGALGVVGVLGTPGQVSFACPSDAVARGVRVRAGALVDAFGLACAR